MAIQSAAAPLVVLDTTTTFIYLLTADPDVAALPDDVREGIQSGALTRDATPGYAPGMAWAEVRPLSPPERDAAVEEAGHVSQLGIMVFAQVAGAGEGLPDLEAAKARAKVIDALPTDERRAYDSLVPRLGRLYAALARRGLVRLHLGAFDEIGLPVEHFDGAAWDTLTSIADRGIRNAAISELGRHVERLSVMSAEGKA